MKTQLVYTEILDFITSTMREDPLVQIVSETGVFIVTTAENSKQYPLDFYPVDADGKEAYGLRMENGKLISTYIEVLRGNTGS